METLPGEHNTDRATEPDNALNLAAVPGLESQRTELQDELAPGSSRVENNSPPALTTSFGSAAGSHAAESLPSPDFSRPASSYDRPGQRSRLSLNDEPASPASSTLSRATGHSGRRSVVAVETSIRKHATACQESHLHVSTPIAENTSSITPQRHTQPSTRVVPDKKPAAPVSGTSGNSTKLPYLALDDRDVLLKKLSTEPMKESSSSSDRIMHAAFSPMEMLTILPSILTLTKRHHSLSLRCASHQKRDCLDCISRDVVKSLKNVTDTDLTWIARDARRRDDQGEQRLSRRSDKDLDAFLKNASKGHISKSPSALSFNDALRMSREKLPARRLRHPLLSREMGLDLAGYGVSSPKAVSREIHKKIYDSLKPSRKWMNGVVSSGDVLTVAWSPDGDVFAAGCAALTDEDNMQYNRPNNLMLGSGSRGVLKELPDHRLLRTRALSGPNATEEMERAMDPWLYYTVPSVCFSPDCRQLYTASYDRTVKVWDVSSPATAGRLVGSLPHEEVVDIVAASSKDLMAIATGSRSVDGSVRVYRVDPDSADEGAQTPSEHRFSSQRAVKQPLRKLYPSSVRWGPHAAVQHLVLAGYSSHEAEEVAKSTGDGDLCLFDVQAQRAIKVSPAARSVFDCIWHPVLPWFASGCVIDGRANRGIRSYVRLYYGADRASYELECPALDVNDITWCNDPNYATASCTDGKTYVWDIRMHSRIMHVLKHGEPIQVLPETGESPSKIREKYDTGIRFAQWGPTTDRFYTGSSDGVVKVWNIYHATEDALVRDVVELDSGIMCGSFSPDYSQLLLGDFTGRLTLLTVQPGPDDTKDEEQSFVFERAESIESQPDPYLGQKAVKEMLAGEEMVMTTVSGVRQAIQGPNYQGPWAQGDYGDWLREQQELAQMKLRKKRKRLRNDDDDDDDDANGLKGSDDDHDIGNSGATSKRVKESEHNDESMQGGKASEDNGEMGQRATANIQPALNEEDLRDDEFTPPHSRAGHNNTNNNQLRDEYDFDCGIFSTELLEEDIPKEGQDY